MGGLTLCGGTGWLLGTAGLTSDNLLGAELVAGTGERVVAGSGGDPELLWGLRGAGGNFGALTTFVFGLLRGRSDVRRLPHVLAGRHRPRARRARRAGARFPGTSSSR